MLGRIRNLELGQHAAQELSRRQMHAIDHRNRGVPRRPTQLFFEDSRLARTGGTLKKRQPICLPECRGQEPERVLMGLIGDNQAVISVLAEGVLGD